MAEDIRNDQLAQVDDLEIEPLTDEAIESISGGDGVVTEPCLLISCSGNACSAVDPIGEVKTGG
jgi:hypothetical protein